MLASATWVCAILASAAVATVPVVTVTGTPYEVGYAVGKAQGASIAKALAADSELQSLLQFIRTGTGRHVLDAFVTTNRHAFPDYYEELAGLSDSSGIAFQTVLLNNL